MAKPRQNKMVPDVVVKFDLNGRSKTVTYRDLPFPVWSELKRTLDLTPRTLMQAISNLDIEGIAALIWLERKQRERRLAYGEVVKELRGDEPEFELTDIVLDGSSMYGDDDEEEEDEEEDLDEGPPSGAATGATPT